MSELLKSELSAADPISVDEDAELRGLVRQMAMDARDAAADRSARRSPWWRRRRGVGPLAIAGAIAVSAAAVMVPLTMEVGGTQVELDVEVPIVYTTDTGVDVSCRYGLYFGDPADRTEADEQLAQFVAGHDWTGIGQRIYEEAIDNPFVPGPDYDGQGDDQAVLDKHSFILAAVHLIRDEIPDDLWQQGFSSGATMDCQGLLR